MAKHGQLEISKAGVDVWNRWRTHHPDVKIDLTGANLTGANLKGANLREANLAGADLSKADLQIADLRRADLQDSQLGGANLTGADLTGANLSKAALLMTNFTKTDLTGADLRYIGIGGSVFGDTNFNNCIGLEMVKHHFPSTIGIDTIRISQGKIPIDFLRGCGLSDLDIEYAKLANPHLSEKEITDITYKIYELRNGGFSIRYNSLFISYSFNDQEFAAQLHSDLQRKGVRCWFAPRDIEGGKKIHEQIDEAIQAHDRLLLILSESSMNSQWVKTEIANARQKEINENRRVLFPISIVDYEKIRAWKNFDADTGKDSAREIREYFIPDFSNWKDQTAYQPSFERLLKDLKA